MAPGMEGVGGMYSTLIAFAALWSKKYSISLIITLPWRDRAGYCAIFNHTFCTWSGHLTLTSSPL